MFLTPRGIILLLLWGMAALCIGIVPIYIFTNSELITIIGTAIAGVGISFLAWLYQRGWEPARFIALGFITLLGVTFLPSDREFLAVIIPAAFGMVLSNSIWIAGSSSIVLLALIIRGQGGIYSTPETMTSYIIIVGCLILARIALDNARHTAEENTRLAEEARRRAENQAEELSRQADELFDQNLGQRQLLDLVATLETPAVSLADGVLLAPIVGHIDTRRADSLTRRLLEIVHRNRSRFVILDVAGVTVVDTHVGKVLIDTVRALQLLGCEVVVTGISGTVAMSLIELGVSLGGIPTAQTPQEALESYVQRSHE